VAVKDPKARRAAVNYAGGRVVGALGLLQYLFGQDAPSENYVVKVDSKGRRRLSGLMNKTAAVGGKQIIIDTQDGDKYQLHYSGALVDFALSCVPKLVPGRALSWSTARGKKRFI
jgi:hypothetical protein